MSSPDIQSLFQNGVLTSTPTKHPTGSRVTVSLLLCAVRPVPVAVCQVRVSRLSGDGDRSACGDRSVGGG